MRARRVQLLSHGAINNLHSRRLSADGDVAIIIAAACNSIYRQKHNARRPRRNSTFQGRISRRSGQWSGHCLTTFSATIFFTILCLLKSSVS